MLLDNFGRVHDYLRISLTDVCNFRCQYCIPDENTSFMPSSHLMTAAEIDTIAREFVTLGVKKIRLTGGEPLVRKDIAKIIELLSKYPVELTMTTNAVRADEFITVFKENGIRSINVSLDTMQKDKFHEITKRDLFDRVWANIQLLIAQGFHVKVNAVIMRGLNDNEILDFIEWTKDEPVHIRFIEFMPFDKNQWNEQNVFGYQEILDVAATKYSFLRMQGGLNDTAKKYKPYGHQGSFAVISTMTTPFCSSCNRLRITADGKMKNCLFSNGEADILGALRKSLEIRSIIKMCVQSKAEALGGQFVGSYKQIDTAKIANRSMIQIGG